jgi:hypothetical protein
MSIILVSHSEGLRNRGLSTVQAYEKDEVTEGRRKLHKGELHKLYCSPNTVMVIKWRKVWAEGIRTRPRERLGCRYDDTIKMDLGE